ncbi:MAG: DUF1631 family protein [Gammaproteobacteria bacterium]|nr:DUF1631 family protein [Gammaproteobacteria bacterium]
MRRRKHPRADIVHSAQMLYQGQAYPGCQILNFSKGGLFLTWGESGLAEVMERGFFGPDRREQASIELAAADCSATADIVYVNQFGIGVAFVERGESLYTYLRDTTGITPEVSPAETVSPRSIEALQSIIQQVRDKSFGFLKTPLNQFFVTAKEDLISATDKMLGSGEQGDLFFAVTTLESAESKISDSLFAGIQGIFDKLLANENPPEDGATQDARPDAELELVDKDEFDEWILLDGIAHRVESALSKQLYQLNHAFSHLLQRPVKHESNPFSPIALLLRLRAALEGFTLIPEARTIIYEAFSRSVFSKIHGLYEELLVYLEGEGVKTGQTVKSVTTQLDAIQAEASDEADPANLENLSVLLEAAHGGPASAQESPYPPATREQVLESMISLPGQGGVLEQLEQHLGHAGEQRFSLDPLTRAAIGASEELVEAVQQDNLLSRDIHRLVNQLEIPFIKESINDPRILENAQHPGRRFLEALERLAPYLSVADALDVQGTSSHAGLRQLMDEIRSGALTNITAVTDQVETLQQHQQEGFQRNCTLAIESCNRQERLWQAQRFIKDTLEEKLLGNRVSIALDRLFEYGWANLLIQTAMLHGEDSVQCKAYLHVVDLLLKLFREEATAIRLREDRASDILKVIRKGFNDYPVYPEGAQQFVNELMQALVGEAAATKNFNTNRVAIDEAYLHRLFQGHVMVPERLDPLPVEQTWIDLVEGLRMGDWIVQQPEGEMHRLVNLAWKDPEQDRYLLVDGNGIKVLYGDARKLAGMFAENQLGIMEDSEVPVVDRAIQRILKDGYDSVQQEVSYDELTGLLNRRAFERLLTELLRGAMQEGERHSILLLDVDQFGLVNDLCGFEGGDKLLQEIANILRTYLPEHAHLARTGDDEFAILLIHSSLDQGFQLAEQHRQAINAFKYTWENQVVPVSTSVGVVAVDNREQTTADLLKAVSSACSIAKQSGRNCTRIYRVNDKEFMQHRALINSVAVLEDALENGKIALVAQPIVPLQDAAGAAHYEILLRVEGDDGELQSPVNFILAAERYNFMRAVDRWVVDTFFEMIQGSDLDAQSIGGFSINLSSQSLADHEFKSYLIQKIEGSRLPRERLGFEITETAMITDSQEAVAFIKEIRETGCSFYLDDFGSGYASFSYLKEMPVDYVKIDGIFIRDLQQDKASHEMVKAITGISHFMHKQVVAEFVENQETVDLLRTIGVDYIQGYHIGRPVSLGRILTMDQRVSVG